MSGAQAVFYCVGNTLGWCRSRESETLRGGFGLVLWAGVGRRGGGVTGTPTVPPPGQWGLAQSWVAKPEHFNGTLGEIKYGDAARPTVTDRTSSTAAARTLPAPKG